MWKNNIKIILRTLWKQKLFTGLNMLGLALGLSIACLLLLYINNELSFNKYHKNFDDIFRVLVNIPDETEAEVLANAPNIVGPIAKENIASVKNQVRLLKHNFGENAFVSTLNKNLVESNLYWADPSLFEIFDIEFLMGDVNSVLREPNQIVLSESTVQKYFGTSSPINQTIKVDHKLNLEVVGVYKDLPKNSSFDAELIGSFSSMTWAKNLTWGNSSFETYLLLEEQTNPKDVESALAGLLEKNVKEEDRWFNLSLQAFKDVHLQSAEISSSYTSRMGDPMQVKLLGYLALIVLIIACINYMNMSTARSQKRFREVGINKTIGATQWQLIKRFYLETAILVFFAFFLALAIIQVSFPMFNRLAGTMFSFQNLLSPIFLGGSAIILSLIILISGSYPAFYLSSFSPKDLFKTSYKNNSSAGVFRKVLVTTQFLASLVIIVGTLSFYKQLNFIQNKNLGYQAEQVLAISTSGAENRSQIEGLINQLKTLPEVIEAGRVQTFPGNDGSGRSISKANNPDQTLMVQTNFTSPEIVQLLDLQLLAGKTLPNRTITKKDSIVQVVLNETAVNYLGYTPSEAIGKAAPNLFWKKTAEIVGVVKDFHFENFHQAIGAYVFHNNPTERHNFALVKLDSKNLNASIKNIGKTFQKIVPNSAFEFTFLDQHLETLYRSEKRTANIFFIFSMLTILIACLGLFGLTSFTAEQRTKEIGIRKVLGASVGGIVGLLSKDFLKLVLISLILAIPLSKYAVENWLQDFAYRVELGWGVFAIAGIVVLVIAFITISFQSIKEALSNPLDSLRME